MEENGSPSSPDKQSQERDSKKDSKGSGTSAEDATKLVQALLKTSNDPKADKKDHAFWGTQPVPKMDETLDEKTQMGPIDKDRTTDEIKKDPYTLPQGFEWVETTVDDEKTISEIYNLLNENYVEDDDNMFRFDYSVPFLKWALKPPGWLKVWHIGVRVTKTGKLVGFITAIPATISVYHKPIKMVEINFLCVHKKLRDKRLAPVLIKEITRRVNLTGLFQAVYTAGRLLPKPVASCRYYHRSLNPKKLIDVGFSHLQPRMTIARTIKLYKLPDVPQLPGIRELTQKDVSSATKLLNKYLEKFSLRSIFEEQEFEHWFTPRDGIVNSYVIANSSGEVTDFASFYTLPSTIIGNQNYKTLKAAYAYYNVATTVKLEDLVRDALIFAKKADFDVYNCLDIMDNENFIKELKFGKGDGNLQYYLYNWRCPEMKPDKMGLVLL